VKQTNKEEEEKKHGGHARINEKHFFGSFGWVYLFF